MRNVLSSGLVAAALGTALIVAGAFPASAQVARPQLGLATSNSDSNLLTLVRGGRVVGGGGRFAMGGGGRFAGGRIGMRGDNRFNVSHRFDRDDRFHRRFAVRNNNAFFFGFGDGGWGWNAYAYGGCVIGYDGLTYCPPYY